MTLGGGGVNTWVVVWGCCCLEPGLTQGHWWARLCMNPSASRCSNPAADGLPADGHVCQRGAGAGGQLGQVGQLHARPRGWRLHAGEWPSCIPACTKQPMLSCPAVAGCASRLNLPRLTSPTPNPNPARTQAMLNYLVGGVVVLTGVMAAAKWSLDT